MSKSKIVIAVALLVLILAACSPPVPTTVPEPTTESLPTLTPTPQPQDTSWQQVQSAGVLRVGTSADYPPFASYDENHQMVGFDIALIQQIGQRLGLPVEIVDYGFDGLPMAVATGDVDVVIGAISVTPERQSIANFSNVYYISTDAVLSRPEANPSKSAKSGCAGCQPPGCAVEIYL